ncbi:chlorohydrolase [Streptococcus pneumoniae]|nr:chlorohydrolase [Streptococcus pneumoniae]
MKIKEQTRKLAAGYSNHSFEVVDKTDEVINHIYGKATLTWVEEFFEGSKLVFRFGSYTKVIKKKRGLSYDSND